jgi:hypothetical protein
VGWVGGWCLQMGPGAGCLGLPPLKVGRFLAGWVGWPAAQPLLPLHPLPVLPPSPLRTHRCSPCPACALSPPPLFPPPPQAFEKITGHSWDRKKIRWEWTDCNDRSETTRAIEEPERETKSGEWLAAPAGCLLGFLAAGPAALPPARLLLMLAAVPVAACNLVHVAAWLAPLLICAHPLSLPPLAPWRPALLLQLMLRNLLWSGLGLCRSRLGLSRVAS